MKVGPVSHEPPSQQHEPGDAKSLAAASSIESPDTLEL